MAAIGEFSANAVAPPNARDRQISPRMTMIRLWQSPKRIATPIRKYQNGCGDRVEGDIFKNTCINI
jgi:hypothetical protein